MTSGPVLVSVTVADPPERWEAAGFAVADRSCQGSLLGGVKDAVQPGRRIATLRREARLSVPVAFMSPDPQPS
jgi:hypothetical protein